MSTPKERVEGFEPQEWENGEEGGTPITAERLNATQEALSNLVGLSLQTAGQQQGIQAQLNSVQSTASQASSLAGTLEFEIEGIKTQLNEIRDRLDALEGEEEETE